MSHEEPLSVSHFFWMLLIVGVGVIGGILITETVAQASDAFQKLSQENVHDEVFISTTPSETYYMVGSAEEPEISAESYLVADLETGQILLSHGNKIEQPIASITKLMTALVAQERLPIQEVTRISLSAIATEGWRGNLTAGDEIVIEDLLYPLLMTSSNDAAEAIAESHGRSVFLSDMNRKARDLGMWDTTFDDASGLSELNRSTANNLFTLTQYLYREHPDIIAISRTQNFSNGDQSWENVTRLLREPTFRGGKSGYTRAAKQTSTGIYRIPLSGDTERDIAIIVLRSPDRENDIRAMIDYVQKYLHYGTEDSVQELKG